MVKVKDGPFISISESESESGSFFFAGLLVPKEKAERFVVGMLDMLNLGP